MELKKNILDQDNLLHKKIIKQLQTIYDPELPVNIYELGLIYDIDTKLQPDSTQHIHITMTLTSPNCPVAGEVVQQIEQSLRTIAKVSDVHIHLTFDPPWNKDNLSEATKLALGLL